MFVIHTFKKAVLYFQDCMQRYAGMVVLPGAVSRLRALGPCFARWLGVPWWWLVKITRMNSAVRTVYVSCMTLLVQNKAEKQIRKAGWGGNRTGQGASDWGPKSWGFDACAMSARQGFEFLASQATVPPLMKPHGPNICFPCNVPTCSTTDLYHGCADACKKSRLFRLRGYGGVNLSMLETRSARGSHILLPLHFHRRRNQETDEEAFGGLVRVDSQQIRVEENKQSLFTELVPQTAKKTDAPCSE
jgi:hypothetical protein